MRDFAAALSEKDQLQLAAIEATQHGYCGMIYIAGAGHLDAND